MDDKDALRAERGRRFSAWLRSIAVDPLTGESLNQTDIGRLIGVRPSIVSVWLNDCYDESEGRVKLPGEENIDKLAAKLKADPNKGRAAAGRPLKDSALPEDDSELQHVILPSGMEIWLKPLPGQEREVNQQFKVALDSIYDAMPKLDKGT